MVLEPPCFTMFFSLKFEVALDKSATVSSLPSCHDPAALSLPMNPQNQISYLKMLMLAWCYKLDQTSLLHFITTEPQFNNIINKSQHQEATY